MKNQKETSKEERIRFFSLHHCSILYKKTAYNTFHVFIY